MNNKEFITNEDFYLLYRNGKRNFSMYWMDVEEFNCTEHRLIFLPDLPN
jgi:hypothetical protein